MNRICPLFSPRLNCCRSPRQPGLGQVYPLLFAGPQSHTLFNWLQYEECSSLRLLSRVLYPSSPVQELLFCRICSPRPPSPLYPSPNPWWKFDGRFPFFPSPLDVVCFIFLLPFEGESTLPLSAGFLGRTRIGFFTNAMWLRFWHSWRTFSHGNDHAPSV